MDQDVANALPPLRKGLYWRISPRKVLESFEFIDSPKYIVVELMDGTTSLKQAGMWETLRRSSPHEPIPMDYEMDESVILGVSFIRPIPYTAENFARVAQQVWDEYIDAEMVKAYRENTMFDSRRAASKFIGDYHPKENND